MKFSSAYEPDKFESEIYAAWESSGVFSPAADDEKAYSIVMPPPNANGNLHIGHGLTVALEDSLTRYYRLRGESTWYIPGADHAGFETWVVYERVLESQGRSRFDYSREELYAQVWDFVHQQKSNMELQVRSLGASCDWGSETFTLDEKVVRRVYKTFEKMWNDGMIYRGEKLVNYCPKHQTAFADIEVEHKDEKGHLWDIAYPYADGSGEVIVSTTRPETLFGDTAVAVNPSDSRYEGCEGALLKLPLTDREIPIVYDEHADPEYGTGAVKITPAHDYDDFEVGERHGLDRIRVIDDAGMMTGCGPEYDGLSTAECRKKVLHDLEEAGLLRGEHKITHAVAHCYKCGTVIEPTLKEQWFINVEKLAAAAISAVSAGEIKFFPASKKKVLLNYLKGLKDWNISRQIPWGIAIPMFHKVSSDGGASDAPEWIFDMRTELSEIEYGGAKYVRDEDTFDTWFSSSHWPIVCTDWEEGLPNPYYPLNVMETGADILFAWVARMIMMGLYVTGSVPFREVYLHGLVLDAHGQKMSKSKGNVLNPVELVSKYGSDAFRMGILRGRSAGMNQAFSENSVVSGRNLCNKLWNLSRLVQSMVDEYEGDDKVRTLNMGEDWICREIDTCRSAIEKQMKTYRFAEAVETLHSLIWDKYADWFIESQKIYKNVPLLKRTLTDILVMLHPFAPFVTEAIWQNLSFTDGMIIEAHWPERLKYDPISAAEFDNVAVVVSEIRKTYVAIPGGKRWPVLFGDDSLADDNQLLIQSLTKAPSVVSCEGQPRGIRLALSGREVYLDVPSEVVAEYASSLEERILAVGRELDGLNARMMNPRYVDKAPAELVEETRRAIAEKESLIVRLKQEREAI
ncbi:valine--tRNA ligase [Candidatus Saccharibacteria bacterium]|nr:valine--tRNA ligase [Candidatus Saccharibacteria bacterium]